MGRNLYEEMGAYWPTSTEAFAPPMNEIPKVIFSRSTKRTDWKHSRVVNGDMGEEIARLKQEPGKDVLVHGGAAFVQSLSRLGLIDEYRIIVHPVVLSAGLPLFKKQVEMKLLSTRSFPAGAVALTYGRA